MTGFLATVFAVVLAAGFFAADFLVAIFSPKKRLFLRNVFLILVFVYNYSLKLKKIISKIDYYAEVGR